MTSIFDFVASANSISLFPTSRSLMLAGSRQGQSTELCGTLTASQIWLLHFLLKKMGFTHFLNYLRSLNFASQWQLKLSLFWAAKYIRNFLLFPFDTISPLPTPSVSWVSVGTKFKSSLMISTSVQCITLHTAKGALSCKFIWASLWIHPLL